MYNYKDEYYKGFTEEQKNNAKRKEYGFIADEFINVFPELVYKSGSDYMKIDYVSMIPILTEAIKEQQDQITLSQNIVLSQENTIIELSKRLDKLEK